MMFSAWKNNKQLLSAISPEKQLFVIVFLAVCGIVYTDSTKINRPGYNIPTHELNEFLTADCSCRTKYFWKNLYKSS